MNFAKRVHEIKSYLWLTIITIAMMAASVRAAELELSYRDTSPFFVSSELPIALGLGLPKTLSAQSLKQGQTLITINGAIKSNAHDSNSVTESLVLDAETASLELGLSYGLSESWQLDFQVAYIKHSSGHLDSLIDNWHELFDFPEGDRRFFEEDDFELSYENSTTETEVSVIEPVNGFSDFRIGMAYVIDQTIIDHLMVRVGLNLPTGEPSKLTGSDKLDVDVGIYASGNNMGNWTKLGWHINQGMVFVGDDESFGVPTRDAVWFNSLGLNWTLNSQWQIKGQLDSHGSFFDSQIQELAKNTSQLTLGLAYTTTKKTIIEVYFSEDLTVNRAADFSVGIGTRFFF